MKISPHFARSLYHDQSPASAAYFESRHPSLFVADSFQSWVDACVVESLSRQLRYAQGDDRAPTLDKTIVQVKRQVPGRHVVDAPSVDVPILDGLDIANPTAADANGLWVQRLNRVDQVERFAKSTAGQNRLFLVRQRNSYSRLSINWPLFESLLGTCHVFAQFRDFVLCFGTKSAEADVGAPHMRFRPLVDNDNRGSIGGFECAYILRLAELNNRGDEDQPWSVRQFAVYHRYVSSSSASTWIFVALTKRTEARLGDYLRDEECVIACNPFEVHMLLIDTAIANWRPYLVWLTSETNTRADRVIVSSLEDDGLVPVADFTERQRLKQLEDSVLDLLLILDSTIDTCDSMLEKYTESTTQTWLGNQEQSSDAQWKDDISQALREKKREVGLLRTKVETLRAKVAGTTELVSTLLELSNGHSLKVMAEESRTENATMRLLTERGFRDAVAVKVLTIVTLVYLPTTVVSNFFSTQFVGQTEGSNGHRILYVTADWWILIVVSVPLTVFTLYIWWFYVQKQAYGAYPRWFQAMAATIRVAWVRSTGRSASSRSQHRDQGLEM